jgi:hypothetical protein
MQPEYFEQPSTAEQIKEVEVGIEQAKKHVELAEALKRLFENKDFQKVILQDYLHNEPARLVELKVHPQFQSEQGQKSLDRQLDGVGALRGFFRTIEHNGEQMQRSLDDHRATHAELLQEQALQ